MPCTKRFEGQRLKSPQWWSTRTRAIVIVALALGALALTTVDAVRVPNWEMDNALILYAGQEIASGKALFKDAMVAKGPLPAIISGVAIAAGRLVGLGDVQSGQYVWRCLLAAIVVVGYLWGRRIWRDEWAGLFTGAAFLSFSYLLHMSAVGPRAKVPLVLAMILLLLCVDHRQWLFAGCAAWAAFSCWQPAIVMVGIVGIAVRAKGRWKGAGLYVLAFAVLQGLLMVWLAAQGALKHYVGFTFYWHIFCASRENVLGAPTLGRLIETAVRGFPAGLLLGVPVALGIVLWKRKMGWVRWSYPAIITYWIVITVLDMQGPADLFPLLPFVALAAGAGASEIAHRFRAHVTVCILVALTIGLSVRSATSVVGFVRLSYAGQKDDLQLFRQHVAPDETPLIIGRPDLAVLGGWSCASGYLMMIVGADGVVDWVEPGGFRGWLRSLEEEHPTHLILGRVEGKLTPAFWSWVESHYSLVATRGSTGLWERKPIAADHRHLDQDERGPGAE